MEICFLGTSGHGITIQRNHAAAIINNQILIDSGEGTVKSLYQNQISLDKLKAVFLTHLHSDHAIGLVTLICQLAYYDQVLEDLPIYVPEGMKNHLEALLENTFHTFQGLKFSPNIIELSKECPDPLILDQDEFHYDVQWTQTIHNPLCYAYRFNNDVVFSGDTAKSENVQLLSQNVEYLIHEATFPDPWVEQAHRVNHSTPSEAAEIAQNANANHLILYHVPDLAIEDEEEFLNGARDIFPNIQVAHDNDRIVF